MAKLKNAFFIGVTACIGLCTALINTAAAEPKAAPVKPAAQQHHSQGSLHVDAVAKPERLHQSANRSYQVRGVRYTPMTNVRQFSQTGRASWYGRQFHGRLTASGERYDMNLMTAAHKTLPIPSYARVTNLSNGKSVVVRINDRGPFHSSRVIDVSQSAARQLGFIHAGTANVRIEQVLPNQARAEADTRQPAAKPAGNIYVDLRRFDQRKAAYDYVVQTTTRLRHTNNTSQQVFMVPQRNGGFLVRMGPFSHQEKADQTKAAVTEL
ncbi:septal ring lytic transglycosylase RlpA family protein [Eikenella sp. S3360]|uniref:Endolytic peptidoglycan transglycosylase RlpA n=1 Tax=Eikenella glucosivorans TaxID=2766967 RepID=A0ABS0NAW9_9NEIS|nr:septal ring lytic transglycosylase RlpA family protein [Eikenella glucosivorans]MBH5329433.1 septal ring lytic transglycosylase RlpA family protein [Eikenella glucosivorans]